MKHLYVLPDFLLHLISGFQWFSIYPFDLKTVEKALRACVILAFTLSTYATYETVFLQ